MKIPYTIEREIFNSILKPHIAPHELFYSLCNEIVPVIIIRLLSFKPVAKMFYGFQRKKYT